MSVDWCHTPGAEETAVGSSAAASVLWKNRTASWPGPGYRVFWGHGLTSQFGGKWKKLHSLSPLSSRQQGEQSDDDGGEAWSPAHDEQDEEALRLKTFFFFFFFGQIWKKSAWKKGLETDGSK